MKRISIIICLLLFTACTPNYEDGLYQQVKFLQARGFTKIRAYSDGAERGRKYGCLSSDKFCTPFEAISQEGQFAYGAIALDGNEWTVRLKGYINFDWKEIQKGITEKSDETMGHTVQIFGEAWKLLNLIDMSQEACHVKLGIGNVGQAPLIFDTMYL